MKTIVGEGIHFERIRRITGYLVGGLERFNDAKRAEERDRLKHVHVKNIVYKEKYCS
ncbi:anaerobic ribonucleoside-triphosphate reductase [uncultured Mailhella sp.]|uniref:anaerobic ribonucleoside-triphosphate reductase n=1 Tax=uncultured Mailhella sp. TaxID=1981031 RepID=UPI0025ED1840|nr:anaerobic ribonucleoside-triphosphate reductase [uncultured Mailhella sp.]